jgi:hypothetical protein
MFADLHPRGARPVRPRHRFPTRHAAPYRLRHVLDHPALQSRAFLAAADLLALARVQVGYWMGRRCRADAVTGRKASTSSRTADRSAVPHRAEAGNPKRSKRIAYATVSSCGIAPPSALHAGKCMYHSKSYGRREGAGSAAGNWQIAESIECRDV